jgi:hypothetical protein
MEIYDYCNLSEQKLRHQNRLDWAEFILKCINVGIDLGIKIHQYFNNMRRNDWRDTVEKLLNI